jgi:DnaJ-class molecular chaperone
MYLTLGALITIGLTGYLLSVRRHPYRPCRRCKGAGKHFGAIFGATYRPCTRCGGFGRKTRFGARIVSNV